MRAELIRIGNSQGVRLPQAVIKQAGLEGELDLSVADGAVVIRPGRPSRRGWREAAAACRADDDATLADWDSAVGDFEGEWE